MNSRLKAQLFLFSVVLALLALVISCESGPRPPAQGTPEWHWQNAETTWQSGDLPKTADNLGQVISAGGPLAARALPWRLVLTAGLASGYMDIADALEQGGRANQAAATEFRRLMNNYRTMANRQVGAFYETNTAMKQADPAGPIPLAFSFPTGSALPVAELNRAREGAPVSEAEISAAERRVLQRAVLLKTSVAVGAEEDTAKAQQVFNAEDPTVPKDTFMLGTAKMLQEITGYYGPYKLDRPDRLKLFGEQALEILKSLPESDESKELVAEIEKEIKAAEKR